MILTVITDISMLKSLNDYILRRIQEIPLEIKETFLEPKKFWKCDDGGIIGTNVCSS